MLVPIRFINSATLEGPLLDPPFESVLVARCELRLWVTGARVVSRWSSRIVAEVGFYLVQWWTVIQPTNFCKR
jgi:hypothetical protein